MSDPATPAPPYGFKPFRTPGGFFAHNGPVYYRQVTDDNYLYGMRVDDRHTNPDGIAHGGLLYAFADQFMGRSVFAATRRQCATIKMATEYLAPARPGNWLEGRATLVKVTRTLAFMQGDVFVDAHHLLSAEGIWKLFKPYAAD